ncbi:lytic transglycosylase domain-containing protein [bacterium]|nr:lytic transglycosylase domain-containing protein [bacterium]
MIKKIVLTAIALVSFLASDVQAAISEEIVKDSIVKHSIEMGVDPALALSIAKKESGFKHELKSPYGAVGVFQVLPSTAKKIGFNPYYLNDNIKAGLTYYKMMYKMFGSTELALAAYNAGPGNVKKYGGTIPPFRETKRFVNVIMQDYQHLKNNPDPAIAKYNKKIALEKEAELVKQQKESDLPDLKEIPETRKTDPVMEIL